MVESCPIYNICIVSELKNSDNSTFETYVVRIFGQNRPNENENFFMGTLYFVRAVLVALQ